jgi:hypothetical protein
MLVFMLENHCFVLLGKAVADGGLTLSGGRIPEKKYFIRRTRENPVL